MSSILDTIMSQVSGSNLDAIAQKIGADRQQTQSALSAAVPTMIEALGRQGASGVNLESLVQKISGGQAGGGGILDNIDLGALLGSKTAGTGGGGVGGIGDLLSGILGQKQSKVESSIGKSSGLSGSQISMLLAMVAPLVLGALTKKAKASNSTNMNDVLQEERAELNKSSSGSMLGKMFDQDGDGDFDFSDVIKLGMGKLFSRG